MLVRSSEVIRCFNDEKENYISSQLGQFHTEAMAEMGSLIEFFWLDTFRKTSWINSHLIINVV